MRARAVLRMPHPVRVRVRVRVKVRGRGRARVRARPDHARSAADSPAPRSSQVDR